LVLAAVFEFPSEDVAVALPLPVSLATTLTTIVIHGFALIAVLHTFTANTSLAKPCVEARGLAAAALDKRIKLAGMNEFHAAAKQPDARVVNF
jgi:hypothetical protein